MTTVAPVGTSPPRSPAPPPYARRRVIAAIALLLAVASLGWVATVSPLVSIERVVVRGTDRLRVADVMAAGGIHEGDSLVWFRPGRAAARIRALATVGRATVSREWPHTVRVVVSERLPVAWFSHGGVTSTVDATGRVLARVDAPPVGMPQLVGVHGGAKPGSWISPTGPPAVAAALPETARADAVSVSAVADGVLALRMRSGIEVRLGHPDQLAVKIRAALAVIGSLGKRTVTYVDVSVPTNPVAG